MKTLYCEKLTRIIKNKKLLEKELNIEITNKGKSIFIKGKKNKAIDEYTAEKIIDALNIGFPFSIAMLLRGDFIFEVISIKNYTKRHDLDVLRARIIGKKGKTLNTLSELTGCYFELKNNYVGIIGPAECIENAQHAVISLIKGSKQANVYSFLEKHQPKPIEDLGLKK